MELSKDFQALVLEEIEGIHGKRLSKDSDSIRSSDARKILRMLLRNLSNTHSAFIGTKTIEPEIVKRHLEGMKGTAIGFAELSEATALELLLYVICAAQE